MFLISGLSINPAQAADDTKKPNMIFILADDLGYGELGCYGQQKIKTPHLDQMADEGMRWTQFYAGATVCAPSRCVLMTGLHNGHAYVRGNGDADKQCLRENEVTLPKVLHQAGYQTALIGKWGLGEPPTGQTGYPLIQGFDRFYGYLSQSHAHNYYPLTLWDQDQQITLRNEVVIAKQGPWGESGHATKRVDYTHDLFMEQARQWIKQTKDQPFFLYLSLTIPHANNEGTRATGNGQDVPDYGQYAKLDWSDPCKGQAAMISRMDQGIADLLQLLKDESLDDNTIVFFSSDNGPHKEGGVKEGFFDPNGPLRGSKRDMYEGGIRVPFIVRWPGHVPAKAVTDQLGYFGDMFATMCELAHIKTPTGLDSVSLVPELTGHHAEQQNHEYLYWEFYEQGSKQALRQGDWKVVRMPMKTGKVELYHLSQDLAEEHNVAQEYPEITQKLTTLMDEAHVDNPNWVIPTPKPKNKSNAKSN
jgi:uncharacterized sulfatase